MSSAAPSPLPVQVDEALVRRLLDTQFPHWAELPIVRTRIWGTDNAMYRLGADKVVRLPRFARWAPQVDREQRWLPRLAPHLPVTIPVPLALGQPAEGYPFRWSVYPWLEGENPVRGGGPDPDRLARDVAEFILALRRIDPAGGPSPEASNLLTVDGRLRAVIDFGCLGVGDPACDLMVAWTLLPARSRAVFRAALAVDDATWARGRGWGLAMRIPAPEHFSEADPDRAGYARRIVAEFVADHRQDAGTALPERRS